MATPPGWAHPYATVWDDFAPDSTTQLLDMLPAGSGQAWLQETQEVVLGTISDPVYPYAYRGLADAGRTSLGSCNPDRSINQSAQPSILVPGATGTNAYVRADIYIAHTGSVFGTDVAIGLSSSPHPRNYTRPSLGWILGFDDSATLGLTSYDNTFTMPAIEPVIAAASQFNQWMNLEFRLDNGTVTVLVNGAVVGSAAADWPMGDSVYALFYPQTNYLTPADGAYVDNFEAGPLAVAARVPQLSVGQGPQKVRFESPRPI